LALDKIENANNGHILDKADMNRHMRFEVLVVVKMVLCAVMPCGLAGAYQ
jgi:hypothetical protein